MASPRGGETAAALAGTRTGANRQEREENLARLLEIAEEREKATPQLQELTKHQQTLSVRETQLTAQEKERGELQIQLGGVRQKLEHLQKRKAELKTKRERISEAERGERLYKILTTAFSRNGIPAMIVEQALPELENDANALLHRLTNGRARWRLNRSAKLKPAA
jgi:exonuclease SbcC